MNIPPFRLLFATRHGRRGRLATEHGVVETPAFMPIATKAAVKSLTSADLHHLAATMILSNTYHLFLRPGMDIIKRAGGLHRFMGWSGPILTDSGGYQVYSLSKMRKMSEVGVTFRSHLDGQLLELTPERSIEIQHMLGSDIMMALDECLPHDADSKTIRASIALTSRWAKRCKIFHHKPARGKTPTRHQLLFGIVQGGVDHDLRRESAAQILDIGFDGYAIGGLAVGEKEPDMFSTTKVVTSLLPENRPRYFMGGAHPSQIIELVRRGIDLFDCVIPTRNARHGKLFVWANRRRAIHRKGFYRELTILNQKFQRDFKPLDPFCDCETCSTTTRAYLRHLFMSEDPLAARLATIHNLRFYMTLMEQLRVSIEG